MSFMARSGPRLLFCFWRTRQFPPSTLLSGGWVGGCSHSGCLSFFFFFKCKTIIDRESRRRVLHVLALETPLFSSLFFNSNPRPHTPHSSPSP